MTFLRMHMEGLSAGRLLQAPDTCRLTVALVPREPGVLAEAQKRGEKGAGDRVTALPEMALM